MNQRQYQGKLLERRYGLHPFHRLCGDCPLPDCSPGNKRCPQHQVIGHEPKGDVSWLNMTKAMLAAGMADDELIAIARDLGIDVNNEVEHG